MKLERELSTLEYVVLGLISMEPQSGYTIINYFEDGAYSWSASPGSVYPLLKRLEKGGIIAGELDTTLETRPRKMYVLTPFGEELLDEWLRTPPEPAPILEERDKAMWKFLFMGKRFTTPDVIIWLNKYEERLNAWNIGRQVFRDVTQAKIESEGLGGLRISLHQQLLIEQNIMEVNMQRTWIQMARARLEAFSRQTGEYDALPE